MPEPITPEPITPEPITAEPTTAEPITGVAAGVPFTALPPQVRTAEPAPLLLSWHMLDAPRTDTAFAAALPLRGVPAWRVHLGMPNCGRRMPAGGLATLVEEIRRDRVLGYLEPFVREAVEEFPAALAALRARLPVGDGPIGVLGASLGGSVVLRLLAGTETGTDVPISVAALVNPAPRARSVLPVLEQTLGQPYTWTEEATAAIDALDFVAAAGGIAARRPAPPLLILSGEQDHAALRADAAELIAALHGHGYPEPAELVSVPGLAHPLAEEPGLEPGGELPAAATVDALLTDWFSAHL